MGDPTVGVNDAPERGAKIASFLHDEARPAERSKVASAIDIHIRIITHHS
jgi:hypothetical protein